MKKYIRSAIDNLKYLYPTKRITIINGFLGVINGEYLKHTTYLGNAYFETNGAIYTDYNCKGKAKKLFDI